MIRSATSLPELKAILRAIEMTAPSPVIPPINRPTVLPSNPNWSTVILAIVTAVLGTLYSKETPKPAPEPAPVVIVEPKPTPAPVVPNPLPPTPIVNPSPPAIDVDITEGSQLLLNTPCGVYRITVKPQNKTEPVAPVVNPVQPVTPVNPPVTPVQPQIQHKKVSIAIVEDGVNRTVADAKILGDFAEWYKLVDGGHTWRKYSPNDDTPKAMEAIGTLKSNGIQLPGMVVRELGTNQLLYSGKLQSVKDLTNTLSGLGVAI